MSGFKKIILLFFFSSSSSLFSMEWLANGVSGGMHWVGKKWSSDYQQKHVISPESKKLANDLERIAIEGTAERALDDQTATDLSRFNERCYMQGELIIELLKKNDYAKIQSLYEESPHQQCNIIFQLFMLRSLVQQQQELVEAQGKLTKLIAGGKEPTKTPVQIAQDIKRELLQRLIAERQTESNSLLEKFLTNTTSSEKPAASSTTLPAAPAAAQPLDTKAQLLELLGKVAEEKSVEASLVEQLRKQLEDASKKPSPVSPAAVPDAAQHSGTKAQLVESLGKTTEEKNVDASLTEQLRKHLGENPQQSLLSATSATAKQSSAQQPPAPSAAAKQPGLQPRP